MNRGPSSAISTPMQISPSPLQSTRTAANSPNLPISAQTPVQNVSLNLSSQQTPQTENNNLSTANAIQELQNLELLPLVMDLVEDVNTGKVLPKDVTNHSKNLIQIKINRARDILMGISGLSETPEERIARMNKLQKNIANKNRSLDLFKALVAERLGSHDEEKTKDYTEVGDGGDDRDDRDGYKDVEMTL